MNRIILALLLFSLMVQKANAQEDDFRSFFTAYQNKEFKKAMPYGEKVLKEYDHHSISVMLAEAYAQSGEAKKSMALLKQLAKRGLPYDISQNPNLQLLSTQTGYCELENSFKENAKPVYASKDAFQLSDASLIPENIAYHDGSFYIGSLSKCKIVKYKDGIETDFFRHDSLWSVVGMKIDPDSNSIWVCTFSEKARDSGYSSIFNVDLKTGKPLGIFVKKPDAGHFVQGAHLFNDLVVTGTKVYYTDSKRRNVYALDKKSFKDEILIQGGFIYPNGIVIDDKGENLFIACSRGLHKFNLASKKRVYLEHNGISITNDIDGLYYYKGTLIGMQGITGNNDDRIVQFHLDKEQNGIEKVTVLQTWQPDFNLPTTGVIWGNQFYYIANSFVNRLNPDNTIKDEGSLQKPMIKVLNLQ
jgi:hypothetical protein